MSRLKRGTYIGGQQMAAVMGMHPYMSIGDVYMHATEGQTEDFSFIYDDFTKPSPMRRGLIMEAGFIDFIEEHHLKLQKGELLRDFFVVDEEVPFFAGTVDAAELGSDGDIEVIHELTTTSSRVLDAWGNDGDPLGPLRYKWIQNQWYQGITRAKRGVIWLIVADTGEIRRYPVERKQSTIDSMRDDAEEFWLDNVIPKVPPDFDCQSLGAWATAEGSVNAIFSTSNGEEVEHSDVIEEASKEYDDARAELKKIEELKKGAATKLKAALGNGERCKWDGGSVSWKRNKRRDTLDENGVIEELFARLNLTDEEKVEVKKKHTFGKAGARVLRVSLKKEKESGQK